MQPGQRIRNAVLPKIIAGRHLAAETVAAESYGHLVGDVGSGLDENGNMQAGEAQSIGNGAFVAEVGQRNDDAIDAMAVLLK